MITYQIPAGGGGTITCLVCGLTSHNTNDVREKYCGGCHQFHSLMRIRFHDEIDKVMSMTRGEIIDDPGEMWPRIFAFENYGFPEESLIWKHIDPAMMADWRQKNYVGMLIVAACFRSRGNAVIFLSDAFHGSPPPGKTFADFPTDLSRWPRQFIREALMVWVNAIGMKGFCIVHPYTRDGKNRRVFAPEPELVATASSRFSFDLTDTNEVSATLDALHRGREGHLEQQA